jgi:hypothetical protein
MKKDFEPVNRALRYMPLALLVLSCELRAQGEVFVCVNANGVRQYKNTGAGPNCKRVDLQGVRMMPHTKPKSPASKPPLVIGMSEAEVKKKWGPPPKAHRKVTKIGTTETWTYSGGKTLTFHNNLLEAIEE